MFLKSFADEPEVKTCYGVFSLILAILSFFMVDSISLFLSLAAILLYFLQRKEGTTEVATIGLIAAIISLFFLVQRNMMIIKIFI